MDQVWGRSVRVELPQASIATLCKEDLFLALCCHGTVHRWERLKWLLDLAEFLRNSGTMNWSRIEETTRNRPLTRASATLAVLLARELLDVGVSAEAERVLPATQRIRNVSAALRDEIKLHGQTSGRMYWTLVSLERSPQAWMQYWSVLSAFERQRRFPARFAWWLHQVFVQVTPKELALVHLPPSLQFVYHVIRPVRLVLKHSWRTVRTLLSIAH